MAIALEQLKDRITLGQRRIGARSQFRSVWGTIGVAVRVQRVEAKAQFFGVRNAIAIGIAALSQFSQIGDAITVGIGRERIEEHAEFDTVLQSVLVGVRDDGIQAQRNLGGIVDAILVAIDACPDSSRGLEASAQGEEIGLGSGLGRHGRGAPADCIVGGRQSQGIARTGADCHGWRHPGRRRDLLQGRVTPGQNGSLPGQGEGVVVAGGNPGDARKVGGNCSLSPVVGSPADHRSIRFQGHGMGCAGGDGHHSGKSGRHHRLQAAVVAPTDDGAIGAQGHRVEMSRGHGDGFRRFRRDGRLSITSVAPGPDHSIG